MKVLVIDRSSENQATLVRLLESIDPRDQDALDLTFNLATERDYTERLPRTDILILGPGLCDDAPAIARSARNVVPDIQIIIMVSEDTYSTEVFRAAHASGARKVLSGSASGLDLLQEFVTIHEEFRHSGKVKSGRVVAVLQAKGGVGATTVCAAFGEICSEQNSPTLLWDFDHETLDLCRALTVNGPQGSMLSEWLLEDQEISRDAFRDALFPINDSVSVLMPPDKSEACYALMGSAIGVVTINRIIDLARLSYENIVVDIGGRMSPGIEVLLRSADSVIVVIDDSMLGLSAAHAMVGTLSRVLKSMDSVKFLCSGTTLDISEIAAHIGVGHRIPESAFALPALPFDPGASRWPGKGKTLYREGKPGTRTALEDIAVGIGLISNLHDTLRVRSEGASRAVGLREKSTMGEVYGIRSFLQKLSFT